MVPGQTLLAVVTHGQGACRVVIVLGPDSRHVPSLIDLLNDDGKSRRYSDLNG